MGKIAFLFDGQGSQYPGMAKDFYENIHAVRDAFGVAEAIRGGTLEQMFFGTEEELKRTDNAQPCLFLADIAVSLALSIVGIKPDVVAGFSLGEVPALAVAGLMKIPDAFKTVCMRGNLMQDVAEKEKGCMIAVMGMDRDELAGLCEQLNVYPVNYNCPGQIVVSGKKERMEQLKRRLEKRNVRAVELAVGGPFHTPYMEAAASGLRKWMNSGKVMIHQPELILYSNRTAMPYESDKEKIVNTFTEQMMYPVKWEDTLLHKAEAGVDTFIECGPGKVLSGFVKRTIKGAKNYYVCDMESLKRTVKELGTVC